MRSLFLSACVLAGCTLDEVDLTNRHCPCAEGWSCDEARDLCVRADASEDAAVDVPITDGGEDASEDAGTDAGEDAGDGGRDVGTDVGADATDGGRDAIADTARDAEVPTVCDVLSDFIFCDGFESGLGAWDGLLELDGSALHTTTPPIYRGVGALSASTTAASGKAAVLTDFATRRMSMIHARAYVYLPSDPIGTVSFLYLGDPDPPNLGIAVQVVSDGRAQVYNGVVDRLVTGVRPVFPRDDWACVTLDVDIRNNGSVHAEVDGAVIADESGLMTQPAGGIGRLITGIEFTNAATTDARVWIDEVVVSDAPIACD